MTVSESGELEYRLGLPDPRSLDNGSMDSDRLAELFLEVNELGRKKNAKVDLFEGIIADEHSHDVYVFFRQFTNRFAHPERVLGIGKATMNTAAERAFAEVDDASALRREYAGCLSEAMREEGVGTGGESVPVSELFEQQLDICEASADGEITALVVEMFERLSEPWVWAHMVGDDDSFYVGDYLMAQAVAQCDFELTYGGGGDTDVAKALGISNDGPTIFLDWALDDRELSMRLQPHSMIGEMKATKADAEKAAELRASDDDWIAQTKYDGARLFIHHAGDGDYRAYLAGNKDVTLHLPELFEEPISSQLPEFACILDCEVTPYDPETGDVLPFQNIISRTGIKTDEMLDSSERDVEVRFKLFDVLNWHGNDISQHPYRERLEILQTAFTPDLVARTGTDFEAVYQASLDEGHEGVVLKDMDADVDFNVRSNSWLKWKADPMEADLEVVAIHEGDGRTADTVGSLGLATADGETVGAVGTGFTDADRDRLWDTHLSGELRGETVQVCFEEVQISGDSAALRFPSFVSLRPEGEPDSLERIARIADVEDEVDW